MPEITPVLADTVCVGCKRRIGSAGSCTDDRYPYVVDGEVRWLDAIRYGDPRERWGSPPDPQCHDCGVALGELHHWGCDMAQCPNCDRQLLGCKCDMRSEAEVRTGGGG